MPVLVTHGGRQIYDSHREVSLLGQGSCGRFYPGFRLRDLLRVALDEDIHDHVARAFVYPILALLP